MSSPMVPYAAAELLERVVIGGDLAKLQPAERLQYYREVCASLGLNPLTKPFEYLHLNGRLILYARRDATDQLRRLHGISVVIISREYLGEGVYAVTTRATDKTGRADESLGAVSTKGLTGDALANALMKAETKAKRRVTLSLCGLGMLDETEVDSLPPAAVKPPPSAPVLPSAAAEVESESEASSEPEPWELVVNDYVERFTRAETLDEAEGWRVQWLTARKQVPDTGRKTVEAAIAEAKGRLKRGAA